MMQIGKVSGGTFQAFEFEITEIKTDGSIMVKQVIPERTWKEPENLGDAVKRIDGSNGYRGINTTMSIDLTNKIVFLLRNRYRPTEEHINP